MREVCSLLLLSLFLAMSRGSSASPVSNSTRRAYELQQSRLVKEYSTPSVEMRPPPPPAGHPSEVRHTQVQQQQQQVQAVRQPNGVGQPQVQQQQTVQPHSNGVRNPVQYGAQQQQQQSPPVQQRHVTAAAANNIPQYQLLNNFQVQQGGAAGYEQWRGVQQQAYPQPPPSSATPQMQFHSTSVIENNEKELHFLIHRPSDYNTIKQTLQEDANSKNENVEFIQGPNLKLKQEQKLYLPPKKKTIVYVMMAEPTVDLNVEVMETEKEPEPEVYVVYQKPGEKSIMHHEQQHSQQQQGGDYQGQASNVNVVYSGGRKKDFGAKQTPICRTQES